MDVGTDPEDTAKSESALISAVREGDTALVKRLLHEDGEPGLVDVAFRLAIRAYAGHIAQLLLPTVCSAPRYFG
jgi:hypothetical protein